MNQIKKWKYYAAYCSFKYTKEPGFLGGKGEGYWTLRLDKEFNLADGLNHMGELGYELVGIQATDMRNGGEGSGWYNPSCFYIFKKPIETQGDSAQS